MKGSPERYTGEFIEVYRGTNAVLLKRDGDEDDDAQWVPYSQIEHVVRVPKEVAVKVTMSAWIAKKKGFID